MGRKPKQRRNDYGAWLKFLRKEKKLTQERLSDLTKVPQATIAYWEKTGNLPGRHIIARMSKALGVSVTQLLRLEKEKGVKPK